MTRQNELQQKRRDIHDRLRKVQNEIKILQSRTVSNSIADIELSSAPNPEIQKLRIVEQGILAQCAVVDQQIEETAARLRRLQYWLTIESIGGVSLSALVTGSVYLLALFNLSFVYWYSLLAIAALAFTPFMLATIIRAGHPGWVTVFIVMVILPCGLMLLPLHDPFFELAFQLFPLLMFYIYCWTLRYAVDDWLS
jgi:hypothetical protein